MQSHLTQPKGNQAKRRSIFSYLKAQKESIYILQETYSELKDETIWQNEWGGKMYFSHGSRHSKGTCILIDPSIACNLLYSFRNNSGRVVLITVSINGQKVSFCNIYAPNNAKIWIDQPHCWRWLEMHIIKKKIKKVEHRGSQHYSGIYFWWLWKFLIS